MPAWPPFVKCVQPIRQSPVPMYRAPRHRCHIQSGWQYFHSFSFVPSPRMRSNTMSLYRYGIQVPCRVLLDTLRFGVFFPWFSLRGTSRFLTICAFYSSAVSVSSWGFWYFPVFGFGTASVVFLSFLGWLNVSKDTHLPFGRSLFMCVHGFSMT